MRKAEKTRRHDAGGADIRAEIHRMIAILDRRIDKLDRAIAVLIDGDPVLARQARLLRAVPGVGPTVLAVLLGELPELAISTAAASPRWPDWPRTPVKAGHDAGPAASGAVDAACAMVKTQPSH